MSRVSHQLFRRWKSTHSYSGNISTKKAASKKLGLENGNWQSGQGRFCWACRRTNVFWGLMVGIFGIPESSFKQWYQDFAPIQIFFIVASIAGSGFNRIAFPLHAMHTCIHIHAIQTKQRSFLDVGKKNIPRHRAFKQRGRHLYTS
jgi:hypothetical protein